MPELMGLIIPTKDTGDFLLEVDKTEIPITAASVVSVLRSNENATARTAVKTEGYDIILVNANILASESH